MQDLSHKVKENIAKCAIELFKSEVCDSVSVNEICEKANVSRSVFYTMFKGKRGILDYVVSKPQQNDDEGFRRFADAENDFERIWQLFERFIFIALDFGPKLTSRLFIMQFESPQGIRDAVHALDDLFATLAKNCAKNGIIETEEPPCTRSELSAQWSNPSPILPSKTTLRIFSSARYTYPKTENIWAPCLPWSPSAYKKSETFLYASKTPHFL